MGLSATDAIPYAFAIALEFDSRPSSTTRNCSVSLTVLNLCDITLVLVKAFVPHAEIYIYLNLLFVMLLITQRLMEKCVQKR